MGTISRITPPFKMRKDFSSDGLTKGISEINTLPLRETPKTRAMILALEASGKMKAIFCKNDLIFPNW